MHNPTKDLESSENYETEVRRLKQEITTLNVETGALRAIKAGTRSVCGCKAASEMEKSIESLRKHNEMLRKKNSLIDDESNLDDLTTPKRIKLEPSSSSSL